MTSDWLVSGIRQGLYNKLIALQIFFQGIYNSRLCDNFWDNVPFQHLDDFICSYTQDTENNKKQNNQITKK